jgi:hypothetical protein
MPRSFVLMLALATSSAVFAQSAAPAGPDSYATQSPAPIVRSTPGADSSQGMPDTSYDNAPYHNGPAQRMQRPAARQVSSSTPIAGVLLRVDAGSSVQTVSADARGTEIRVTSGRANVNVHQPARNSQILVDLPGGQVDLLKDGLYTFNAQTNTVRVLKGEAEAFTNGAPADAKGVKVKEYQQLVFSGSANAMHSTDVGPGQLTADLLSGSNGEPVRSAYAARPYGDGFYGYGYPYGYGYGYPYGYPYGFGYPYGIGLGIGFGGGFYHGGGGFYGGGFRGYRR